MKSVRLLSLVFVAAAVSACTGSRYTSSSEYDDVYFTSADKAEVEVATNYEEDQYSDGPAVYTSPDRENRNYNSDRYRQVDNYNDAYYQDDDFYYSRRLRRFGQTSNAWRYYDPYFTNDIYYVMGSPYWNRWNNNGWYDWNRPRFGASWSLSYGSPGFYGNSFYSPYSSFNNFYGPSYYNPWVSAYYGYNPAFGYDPFAFGGSGFGYGYSPYGYSGGFYSSAYYCPPTGFVPASSWRRYSSNAQTYTTRVRNSTQSSTSQTQYTIGNRDSRTSTPRTGTNVSTRTASSNNQYLTPRYRTTNSVNTSNIERTGSSSPRVNTRPAATTDNARVNRNTNSSPRVYTRPSRTTTNSNVDRRTTTTNRNSNVNRNDANRNSNYNRNSSNSSNRSYRTPSRNYSTPSRTNTNYNRSNSNINYNRSNTNSNSNSGSFSRPSSSPSYSAPRSSGSSSGGSSGSSGVRRRN